VNYPAPDNFVFRLILLSALLHASLSIAAGADIYKQVLPDGTVVYSDQPSPGAKKIQPPPSQVLQPFTPAPALSNPPLQREPETEPFYTRLAITAPTDNEVIWDNEGTLEVAVSMQPALNPEEGDTLVLVMDDRPVVEATQGTRFVLDDVYRGTHVLKARIEGPDGRVLIASEPVTFHVRQHSLFVPVPPNAPFQPAPQPPPFQPTQPRTQPPPFQPQTPAAGQ
jgi:hypothetical protein